MPGVKIGKGAILGARSVVTKEVEAFVVGAGNPARRICIEAEYVKKCEHKNVLYKVPDAFQKY